MIRSFYKKIINKRRIEENLQTLLDVEGNIVTKDEKKAEIVNACFASAFNKKTVIIKATSPLSWQTKTRSRIERLSRKS